MTKVRVTTVRGTMLFPVSITSKGQINVESPESLSLADILTPCFGKIVWLLPLSDGFQESLRYQESCCSVPVQSKNEQSIEQLLPCGKNTKHPVLVKCLASLAQLMWPSLQQSSSYRSPVLKKGQTCRCQPVTTVREPFSSQFPFSQRVRSMKSVYVCNVES